MSGRYRTFNKKSQIIKAIKRARKRGDKIALHKLMKYKDYKFKRIKQVQIYY